MAARVHVPDTYDVPDIDEADADTDDADADTDYDAGPCEYIVILAKTRSGPCEDIVVIAKTHSGVSEDIVVHANDDDEASSAGSVPLPASCGSIS